MPRRSIPLQSLFMDSPAFIRYLYTICFFSVFHDILFQPTVGNVTKSLPVGPLGRNSGRNQNQNWQEKCLFSSFRQVFLRIFLCQQKIFKSQIRRRCHARQLCEQPCYRGICFLSDPIYKQGNIDQKEKHQRQHNSQTLSHKAPPSFSA